MHGLHLRHHLVSWYTATQCHAASTNDLLLKA